MLPVFVANTLRFPVGTNDFQTFDIFLFLQDDDDDDDEYKDLDKDKSESKPVKKKKVTSSYGLGFLGRFFNLFT